MPIIIRYFFWQGQLSEVYYLLVCVIPYFYLYLHHHLSSKPDAMTVSISPELIEQALAQVGSTRRERVFALAELWHRHTGVLPSIQITRTHVGRGSYGDISRDLKDFSSVISAKLERKAVIPGLPLDLELRLNDVILGLWGQMSDSAQVQFVGERATFEHQIVGLEAELAEANLGRQHALEDRSNVLSRLAQVESELNVALECSDHAQQTIAERDGTIGQLEARIGEMETEKLRLAAEYLTELRALQATLKGQENRILDLQGAAETIRSGYEARMQAGIQLEAEHRARANKAEMVVQQTQERLEKTTAELENLRGQLSGMAARMADTEAARDLAIGKVALLERDLAAINQQRISEVNRENSNS